jgi:non-ribosomal peptide synthetase component F
LQVERFGHRNPLVQVLFTMQNTAMETLQMPGLIVTPLQVEDTSAKVDLIMAVVDTTPQFTVALAYDTDLFEEATIIRMLEDYTTLLDEVVSDPDKPLKNLSLFNQESEDIGKRIHYIQKMYEVEEFDFS